MTPKMKTEYLYVAIILVIVVAVSAIVAVVITYNNKSSSCSEEPQPTTQRPTTQSTPSERSALFDYVEMLDPTYSYRLIPEATLRDITPNDSSTTFILEMTSQTWLTPEKVGEAGNVWWHYMSITVPDRIAYVDSALLFISGGDNSENDGTKTSPPDKSNYYVGWMATMAESLGMVTAVIFQNPNQPIRFPNDPRDFDRYEDDIIAYGWRQFFDGGGTEPFWMVRGPMTKAAVRAMDTVTSFANSKINKFYLSGISKRGWTAWSTAAVDTRVVGVAPMVLDILNMHPNLHHHYRSLNGWTFALEPYWSENTTLFLDSDLFPAMADITDPFSFVDTLTMPKYVITAGNDEFFLPDDAHYFYDQMKGLTYLRVHPNLGHNLLPRFQVISQELAAFVLAVEEDWSFPTVTWVRTENTTHGIITFKSDSQPLEITAYQADTTQTERRDFRTFSYDLQTDTFTPSGVQYTELVVIEMMDNEYMAVTEIPAEDWRIFFVEVAFAAPKDTTIRFTSEVNIIPADKWATEDCVGAGCYGTIV